MRLIRGGGGGGGGGGLPSQVGAWSKGWGYRSYLAVTSVCTIVGSCIRLRLYAVLNHLVDTIITLFARSQETESHFALKKINFALQGPSSRGTDVFTTDKDYFGFLPLNPSPYAYTNDKPLLRVRCNVGRERLPVV